MRHKHLLAQAKCFAASVILCVVGTGSDRIIATRRFVSTTNLSMLQVQALQKKTPDYEPPVKLSFVLAGFGDALIADYVQRAASVGMGSIPTSAKSAFMQLSP